MQKKINYIISISVIGLMVLIFAFVQREKEFGTDLYKIKINNALQNVESNIVLSDLKTLILSNILTDIPDRVKGFILSNQIERNVQKNVFRVRNTDSITLTKQQLLQLYWAHSDAVNQFPVERRINFYELKNWLKDELEKQGVNFPFTFAVVNDGFVTKISDENFSKKKNFIYVTFPLFIQSSPTDQYDIVVGVSKSDVLKGMTAIQFLAISFLLIILFVYLYVTHQLKNVLKLSEIKNDFINNITHEFKTPVASIKLATDFLKVKRIQEDPGKLMHYVNIIKQENQRILEQIEKLLLLSKMEQNKLPFERKEINVHEVISGAAEQIKILLDEKKGAIKLRLNAENPYVLGDSFYLQNLFINLFDNAIKYTEKPPEISVVTYNSRQELVIEVKDNGIGMEADVKNKIFDKFYRKPTGNVHNIKGHGIGLTFVKQVIEKMGGDVYVESKPGKGTKFTIYLKTVNPNYKNN